MCIRPSKISLPNILFTVKLTVCVDPSSRLHGQDFRECIAGFICGKMSLEKFFKPTYRDPPPLSLSLSLTHAPVRKSKTRKGKITKQEKKVIDLFFRAW